MGKKCGCLLSLQQRVLTLALKQIFDPMIENRNRPLAGLSQLSPTPSRTSCPCGMHCDVIVQTLAPTPFRSWPYFCRVALRSRLLPLARQRNFLLGRPALIRRGARLFKTPGEDETEPGGDVSWSPHLPVSRMVKLLSWGVTLGRLLIVCACVYESSTQPSQIQMAAAPAAAYVAISVQSSQRPQKIRHFLCSCSSFCCILKEIL